jgi:hypothetical protein
MKSLFLFYLKFLALAFLVNLSIANGQFTSGEFTYTHVNEETNDLDSILVILNEVDSTQNVLNGNSNLLDFNSPPQIQIKEIQNTSYHILIQPLNLNRMN